LSDQIKEALQLSETETIQVQTAVDRFINRYNAAQSQNMRAVEPGKDDLWGHKAEETRVFEMTSIGAQLDDMRRELLQTTASTLGPDRFKIFQKGLDNWMPFDNEDHGLNSAMCVLNFDRRERYYQPKPGDAWIDWSLSSADRRSSMNCRIPIDHISEVHRAPLQDWIALAKSKPSEGPRP